MEVKEKRRQANEPKAEKDKTEKATGLGRRTGGDIEKWDQLVNGSSERTLS